MTKVHRPCPGGTSGCADIIRMLTFPAVVALGQPENPNLGEKNTHTRGCYGGREQIFLCPQQLLFISRHLKKKRRKGGIPGLNCQSIGVDCRSENGNKKKSQTQATAVSQRFASLQMNGLTGKYLLWLIEKNYNDHHECLERRPSLSCR